MKKLIFVLLLLISVQSMSFAVPAPGGSASIKKDGYVNTTGDAGKDLIVPKQSKISGLKFPLPTNKWFNSLIYNQYNEFSLRMYLHPQIVKSELSDNEADAGLIIGYPETKFDNSEKDHDSDNEHYSGGSSYNIERITYGDDTANSYKYVNSLKIAANSGGSLLKSKLAKLDKYSDWSATVKWTGSADSTKWMKATFGEGFLFTYFEFEKTLNPEILFPYDWSWGGFDLFDSEGNKIEDLEEHKSDSFIVELRILESGKDVRNIFYGIFLPKNTIFKKNDWWCHQVFVEIPSEKKYMSVALLPSKNITEAKNDLKDYYKYAYNFVSDTKAKMRVSSDYRKTYTDFQFSFEDKRPEDFNFEKNKTLFTLFKHQQGPPSVNILKKNAFPKTLRGSLPVVAGNTFTVEVPFYGIIPFFNYNISGDLNNKIMNQNLPNPADPKKNYCLFEKESNDKITDTDTYYCGKSIAKTANLIAVADNIRKNGSSKSQSIAGSTHLTLCKKLMSELAEWFTYKGTSDKKYFAYDTTWGGLIGLPVGKFGTEKYSDHHFHYGYYIYAAAILAMYSDEYSYTRDFVKNYGGMVELLIKDIANNKRNDSDFPYMRHFDFYDSHSWANGMGGSNDRGIDIESSSEAMNAWSAIYLWGLATQNEEYIKLGIYLYANEYQAIKNYFFDIKEDLFTSLDPNFNKLSVSTLFAGSLTYQKLWWYGESGLAREFKGIQLLPLTPAMLYLGYDKTYAAKFYNKMEEEISGNYYWNDIWARFRSLYDPSSAWTVFSDHNSADGKDKYAGSIDDGGTASYTYHFVDFFRQNGTPVERERSGSVSGVFGRAAAGNITADIPSYLVTLKEENGTRIPVYFVYNYTDSNRTVRFYSDGDFIGYINVPAKSFASATELIKNADTKNVSVYPVPFKPGSGGKYDAQGITFTNLKENAEIKIFNIAGELVFEKTVNENYFVWDAKNNYGNKIASGVYIYYIKNGSEKIKGKLAIER